MHQQHTFAFTDITGMKSYDGPTILRVLLKYIDPTASVNVELHCQAIEGAKLQEHKGNVIEIYKSTEHHFQAIVENGHVYDAETYRSPILDPLLSGSNSNFNTIMKSIKSDVYEGYGYNANVAPATLLMSVKQLYTNISRRKSGAKWNQGMHKSWHLPQRLRSILVSSHKDLEDMAAQNKRQSQALTL